MPARLVFLTGSKTGTAVDLEAAAVSIGRNPDCTIAFNPDEVVVSKHHASIFVYEGRYYVRDEGSRNGTYVDGQPVQTVELRPGQQITFGPNGPSAVFELHAGAAPYGATPVAPAAPATAWAPPPAAPPPPPRRPPPTPAASGSGLTGLYQMAREQAAATSRTGRASSTAVMKAFVKLASERSARRTRVIVGVVAAGALVAVTTVFAIGKIEQARLQTELGTLGAQLAGERTGRAELEARLAKVGTQAEAVQAESESMRRELAQSRQAAAQQQRELAQQRGEIERDRRFGPMVTERYAQGVCLIEMVWGYRNRAGQWLRVRGTPEGQVVMADPSDRQSPIFSRGGFGTGFLIEEAGWILTNRHVSTPFAEDEGYRLGNEVYQPAWLSLRAYFPPGNKAFDVEVTAVSDQHDLGLMRTSARPTGVPVLPIASGRTVVPGEKLVLLGYPTGSDNIFWRANETQLKTIASAEEAAHRKALQDGGFGAVVALFEKARQNQIELTEAQLASVKIMLDVVLSAGMRAAMQQAASLGLVQPHVSMGDVTDTTRSDIFHSAPMVGGASGGPVVGDALKVISVNYAMNVAEDRGAVFQKNRSVPHSYVWAFLPREIASRIAGR